MLEMRPLQWRWVWKERRGLAFVRLKLQPWSEDCCWCASGEEDGTKRASKGINGESGQRKMSQHREEMGMDE